MNTVEGGGEFLVAGGTGEEVAGELLDDELIDGEVVVEGFDDPIAVGPGIGFDIGLVAEGIGVAGDIEPRRGHAFAEAGRGEQAIDDSFFRGGGGVGEEGIELGLGRRQSGEIEGDATQPTFRRGWRAGTEFFLFEAVEDEVVDGIFRPGFVGDFRHGNFLRWRNEGPVRFVFRALLDPGFNDVFFLIGEGEVRFRRRHDLLAVVGENADQRLRFGRVFRVPGHGLDGIRADIEPQIRFSLVLIGPVAEKALVREDRQHLAGVGNFLICRLRWL